MPGKDAEDRTHKGETGEDYRELVSILQRIVYSGKIDAESLGLLTHHGVFTHKLLDQRTTARCKNILDRYLKEPMRDAELGQIARRELEILAPAVLEFQKLVRVLVSWRCRVTGVAQSEAESELRKAVDDFLVDKKD